MKKMSLIVMTVAFAISACGTVDDEYYQRVPPGGTTTPPTPTDPVYVVDWYAAADSATMELLNRYWPPMLDRVDPADDVTDKWHFTAQQDNKADPNNNYWHQPHALDAVIDAYNRTPATSEFAARKAVWLGIFDRWFQGVPRFQYQWNEDWGANRWTSRYPWAATDGADGWRNHYIDDMEWQVLTHIRMYEALRIDQPDLAEKYFAKGKEIYDKFIWTLAWDDESRGGTGGVFWMRTNDNTHNSKNACSNGPAMVIAAKLAFLSTAAADREKYTTQAVQIYEWMMSHLWNENGAINDNWNNNARNGGALTYNQGTFIGGCHWLFKLTGKMEYLRKAVKATQYTIANMQGTINGVRILNSESGATEGNNSVFRAIFLRYFVEMINQPAVDAEFAGERVAWYNNLQNWANHVWRDSGSVDKGTGEEDPGEMLFGYDWKKQLTPAEIAAGVNLGNMVSGAVLVEAMNIAKNPAE
jgi:predicted alpha-1,6-mannanase (GH76 family)